MPYEVPKQPDFSVNSRIDRMLKFAKAAEMFPEVKRVEDQIRLYNETLPEEERIPVKVNTFTHGSTAVGLSDFLDMPPCPDCGTELSIRVLPPNDEGYLTQLYCPRRECDVVLNSDMAITEWIVNIREENEQARRNVGEGEEGEQV